MKHHARPTLDYKYLHGALEANPLVKVSARTVHIGRSSGRHRGVAGQPVGQPSPCRRGRSRQGQSRVKVGLRPVAAAGVEAGALSLSVR